MIDPEAIGVDRACEVPPVPEQAALEEALQLESMAEEWAELEADQYLGAYDD